VISLNSLSERLDHYPEAWKPTEPGSKLIGELVEVDLRESDYGKEPYPILTVCSEEDGREYAWHAFHTAARNAVARKKPQPGERVGIVYGGLGEAEPGKSAPVRWRLIVDRQAQPVDYGKLGLGEPGQGENGGDDDIPF
jgi:hypothetical protein